jgi:hypothetical protein
MDDDYYGTPKNPMTWGLIALLLGGIGIVLIFATDQYMIATFLGAAGMLVGGYAISVANKFSDIAAEKLPYMGLAAAGIFASVLAFMVGFVNWLG